MYLTLSQARTLLSHLSGTFKIFQTYASMVRCWFIVPELTMYLQYTGSVHHPSPPVSSHPRMQAAPVLPTRNQRVFPSRLRSSPRSRRLISSRRRRSRPLRRRNRHSGYFDRCLRRHLVSLRSPRRCPRTRSSLSLVLRSRRRHPLLRQHRHSRHRRARHYPRCRPLRYLRRPS
jgi:hypothetical protein